MRLHYSFKFFLPIFLFLFIIFPQNLFAGNTFTVASGGSTTISWAVSNAVSCVGTFPNLNYPANSSEQVTVSGVTFAGDIHTFWINTHNGNGSAVLNNVLAPAGNYNFQCTDGSSGATDIATLVVCPVGDTVVNNTCTPPPAASASFTSTPSCTISAGASTCTSPISWTSANVTYASLTDSALSFPTGLYGSYGPGAVTYNPGGTPPGVTIPYAPASTLEANKPKYYIHNVTAGGTDLGTLASVAGTADCTAGTAWNGSVCAVPLYSCGGTIPTGPSGSIASNNIATGANQNWTYSAPGTSACTWVCNSGYVQSGTSCVAVAVPSASFTSTPSCTIASGASTCQSPVSWTSANVTYAILTDCGGGLYTTQGAGAITYSTNGGVTVPYGSPNAGGCYQIRQDALGGAVLSTVYSTGTCTAGTAWDGAKCTPTFYSCSGTVPTGANFTSRNATTANGTWAYSPAGECTWSCNSGYVQSGNTCIIPSNNLPTGVIDAVSSGPIGTCGMASGWSYDADNTSVSNGIHIYVDGPAGVGTGYNTGVTSALRQDVNNVFGISGNHGYNFQIPNLTVGNHTAYSYGIGIDTAGNPANESVGLVNNPITFNCSQTTYTVTPSVTPSNGTGGNINPNTPQTVNSGGTANFTVTPNPGYSATVAGSCGGNTIPTTGGTYTTNTVTSNCTVDAIFTLITCQAPLTQNVTVACDPIAGNSVTGLVTRSQNKSAYTDNPSCAFPALPVTNLNSTYVSDTCVYTPNSCTNQTKTWLTNCNASTGIIANGGSASLNFNNGTYTGNATYSCDGVTDTYTYVSGSCTLIPPSTPTGFSASPSTCGKNWINLAWTVSPSATSYTVNRDGVDLALSASCGADNICRVSDTGLILGSTHSYTVKANNAGGPSLPTATQSATVASACPILTVNKAGTGTGTVTSSPGTISCGTTCSSASNVYNTNDAVTLSASPAVTSIFAGWSGSCSITGGVTMSTDKTCVATFNLGTCSPPTVDVDIACDFIDGTTYTGKLVRTVTKTPFPTCSIPAATTNDPIKSNTCVWYCTNGSARPTTCFRPKVVDPVLTPNNDPNGKISFSCTDSDFYALIRDGITVTSGAYTGPITINLSNFGSKKGNYLIKCFSGPDDTSVFDQMPVPFYDPVPLSTDSVTLEATPITIKSGTVSTLTWGINRPSNACAITASPVCAGGSACDGVNDAVRVSAAATLTSKLLTEATDANDPYGSRTMINALRAEKLGNKALGKKSIKIDYTTDFLLNCEINIEGRPNPTKKLRVQVTNDNEG